MQIRPKGERGTNTSSGTIFSGDDTVALGTAGYTYNAHGVSFTVSEADFANVSAGASITIAVTGAKTYSTANDWGLNTATAAVTMTSGITVTACDENKSATSIGVIATTAEVKNNTAVEYALDVSTYNAASAAITTINNAITSVPSERSKLGAIQNRLEHTIKNLDTSSGNLQSAESRIRDVDMAKEMMNYTKQNILQQAATSMLAQANQAPQTVLQLLK